MTTPDTIPTNATQQWIKVSDLSTDPRVNTRPINQRRVKAMAAKFDPDAIGVILVSHRADGDNIILDGQHRWALMYEVGWDDQSLPSLVHEGLTLADEARIFRIMNQARSKPRPLDMYFARLTEGDPDVLAIQQVLDARNLAVRVGPQNRTVVAVKSLIDVQEHLGSTILAHALEVLENAWGDDPNAFQGDCLIAVSCILHRYPQIDRHRFATCLSGTTPTVLIGKARMLKDTLSMQNIAFNSLPLCMVNIYNARLRVNPLPEWEVRNSKAVWAK